MSIIELTDTVNDILKKVSKGNPGALNVCCSMIKKGDERENDSSMGGVAYLLLLDEFEIYGPEIWMLFKDVCDRDLLLTMGMLRACQLGTVTRERLHHAIQNSGYGVDVKKEAVTEWPLPVR
jgi:hypothetical protein